MSKMKPHLACDVDLTKLKFPVIVMPKIDGVRGINLSGKITGRSLKEFKNPWVTQRFSEPWMQGIDGELALGDEASPTLCADTTGFVNRKTAKAGKPVEDESLVWWAFDYLHESVIHLPYIQRVNWLSWLICANSESTNVRVPPWQIVESLFDLYESEEVYLKMGYEGIIIRDPNGMHKDGRCTVKEAAYMRLKRFVDFEGEIVDILEAQENQNEAKINELGHTERSSHKENKVAKGMAGTIVLRLLSDVKDTQGNVVLQKHSTIDVGPGNLKHNERIEMWGNKHSYIGQVGKAKMFPKGIQDKPRFPTFISVRAKEDMSE